MPESPDFTSFLAFEVFAAPQQNDSPPSIQSAKASDGSGLSFVFRATVYFMGYRLSCLSVLLLRLNWPVILRLIPKVKKSAFTDFLLIFHPRSATIGKVL